MLSTRNIFSTINIGQLQKTRTGHLQYNHLTRQPIRTVLDFINKRQSYLNYPTHFHSQTTRNEMSSTMRALTVTEWGQAPILATDVPVTTPSDTNKTQIRVLASGLANVVRSMATGKHYSVDEAVLPYVPGVDGVGLTVPDNKLVYFTSMANKPAPGGAMAEYVTVDNFAVNEVPISADASDETKKDTAAKIAALMNPAMSSWMAMKQRAHVDDYTRDGNEWNALIIGATSTSGRIAALQARHLGASKVIGIARGAEQLEALKSQGVIDIAIPFDQEDVSKTDFSLWRKVFPHVILDYVYGPVTSAVLKSIPHTSRSAELAEARYVHIGTLGKEPSIALEGPLLRSTNVTISGSGPGAWSLKALARETPAMLTAITELIKDEQWASIYGVSKRSIQEVSEAWADSKARTVFLMVD